MPSSNPIDQPSQESKEVDMPLAITETNKAYKDLKFYFGYLNTLFSIRNTLAIDMMTFMAPAGLKKRLNDMSSITKRIYAETTGDKITSLLAMVEKHSIENPDHWTSWDLANIQEMRRIHNHLVALPPGLYLNMVRASNEGRKIHAHALETNKAWQDVLPYVENLIDVYRQAAIKKQSVFNTDTSYEALLRGYASDITEVEIDKLHEGMLAPLTQILKEKLAMQAKQDVPTLKKPRLYSKRDKTALCHALLKDMGFDFSRGNFFVTKLTPMCDGHAHDTRILIRCDEKSHFLSSIEDALYHGSKGLYIQSLPQEWATQPVGREQGALLTASISILYKVFIGRSREFFEYLMSIANEHLTDFDKETITPDFLFKAKHQVRHTAIRNDGDALTKMFHDILRYRIERDLINDRISVEEIPERWNKDCKTLLGLAPYTVEEGAMQNPDWFTGKFGFIAVNSLSYMIAAQLYVRMLKDIKNLPEQIKTGDFSTIHSWLTNNIFQHGRSIDVLALIKESTKENVDTSYMLNLFKDRYLNA